MCVRLLLSPPVPSFRISTDRSSKEGRGEESRKEEIAVKQSSYFAPHEEKQRAVDSSASPRFFPPFCFQGRTVTRIIAFLKDTSLVFNGLINAAKRDPIEEEEDDDEEAADRGS